MKVVGVLVNLFFPGIGTMIVGKVGQGILQLCLYLLGVFLTFTGIGAMIGIPICIIVWIWALVSAATSAPQPIQVNITNTSPPVV
jgi:TM2 domain-containing membrane protein YozV